MTGDRDVAAVLRRRDGFASRWHDEGQLAWLDSAGNHAVPGPGPGRIGSERAVEVTDDAGAATSPTARHAVVITTGGRLGEADEVLVAIGRTPNAQDIGLDAVGLKPGAWLAVDDTPGWSRTTGRPWGDGWLYAGDADRRVLLTHQGKYHTRAVGDVLLARARGDAVDDGPGAVMSPRPTSARCRTWSSPSRRSRRRD